jgi:hypothetical protein
LDGDAADRQLFFYTALNKCLQSARTTGSDPSKCFFMLVELVSSTDRQQLISGYFDQICLTFW